MNEACWTKECWINGIIVAIKIFLIKKVNQSFNQDFETRSRLQINFYQMGRPFNMYTIISMYTEILSYSTATHIW